MFKISEYNSVNFDDFVDLNFAFKNIKATWH